MAKVVLKDLCKVYDKSVTAVKDLSLTVEDKEFVVLVGPSGCGKSTALRMIAGLEEITAGEIYIGDTLVNKLTPRDRDTAMVFQNYALYPHMTVYENMAFSLTLRKENKKEIDLRVRQAAEMLDISDLLKRKPKALSGGQRQRVAIGRAIVRRPSVFLMDEPLSNLDAKLRNQMRAELITLRQRIDTTFLYVTHDQTEAMTLGDRIVIMKDGLMQQADTPRQVFAHPANLFVAGFIGTPQMNFFDAQLLRNGSGYGVRICGATYALDGETARQLAANGVTNQPLIAGIRPEQMQLDPSPRPGDLTLDVQVCEMMGSTFQVHGQVCGTPAVAVIPAAAGERLHRGDQAALSFRPVDLHLFDPTTEKNLLP